MTQVTQVTPLKKADIEQMNHMIEDWLKNNEPNIINMKSNTEKATLRPLIKVLYNEFDDLFLNVKPFFIRAVMKFVIQQKLLNLHRAADSNKGSQKDSEPTTPSVLKEAIVKEPPLGTNIQLSIDGGQYQGLQYTGAHASKHNCQAV